MLDRSFDVLHLFADLFDLGFYFQAKFGHLQALALRSGRFRKQGVGFALHFLKQKIELLANVRGGSKEGFELPDMTCEAREFFGDVAALGGHRGFLCEASGIENRFAEQFL